MGNWDNDRSFSTESISPFAGIEFGRVGICKREQKDAYIFSMLYECCNNNQQEAGKVPIRMVTHLHINLSCSSKVTTRI